MEKVLITGMKGYIGGFLGRYLEDSGYSVNGLDLYRKSKGKIFACDITDYKNVLAVVKKIKPDIIIHAAGLSNLAVCEKRKDLAYKINLRGAENIAKALNKYVPSAKLVFLSTDYVFRGAKGNYSESDKPSPVTNYGKSKFEAEKIIRDLKNSAVVRTANVFGCGGNFFNAVINALSSSKKFSAFSDVYFTPTYVGYLVDSVRKIIESDLRGIFHVAGRDKVSRYRFAKDLSVCLGKGNLVISCKQGRSGLFAKDSSLDCKKTRVILGNYSPPFYKSLQYALGNLAYPYMNRFDKRGSLFGLSQGKCFREVNYIETKKGAVRGGHLHNKASEAFFIIHGKVRVTLKNKLGSRSFVVEKGDFFFIRPKEYHIFEALSDTGWLNMYDIPMSQSNPDIHRLLIK